MRKVRLGEYIEVVNTRNSDMRYDASYIEGVNSEGMFCPTKASTDDINLKPYKIVQNGDFVYNPSRLNIGSLSYRTTGLCIVSHLYVVFHLNKKGKQVLIPEFLWIIFSRDEFRRLVDYRNFGSQRPEFNFYQMGDIEIPLPDFEVQRDLVAAWQGLKELADNNAQMADPLFALCQSYLKDLKQKYPMQEIGPYIQRIDRRNSDNKIKIVKSVSVTKEFKDTNAKVDKSQLQNYKIVRPGEASFVQTTGNEKCLCFAVSHFTEPIVVTSVNEVISFNEDHLLADFLYLWIFRKEFDRYARFNSWGSVRELFKFEDMCRVKIPLPPIEVQKAIVAIYRCAQENKAIAGEAAALSKSICPALMRQAMAGGEP